MSCFSFTRVRFNRTADVSLRTLAVRTHLRPNVLCRAALATSLAADGWPDEPDFSETSTREINRGTLLGNLESAFLALIKQRSAEAGRLDSVDDSCVAHIHRGIAILVRDTSRVRGVADWTAGALGWFGETE